MYVYMYIHVCAIGVFEEVFCVVCKCFVACDLECVVALS